METDIEQGNQRKFVSSRTKNAKLQRNLEKTGVHGGAFDHVVKMYQNCNDSEEGFKNSVVQWSAAYYVAYALLITVALGLLYNCPEPRDTSKDVNMVHARIHSDTLDSVVGVLYLACASAASYYSAWGLMLSVEWSLRVNSVPACGMAKFMEHLNNPEKSEHVYVYNPYHWGWNPGAGLPHSGKMVAQGPAWDPFFFFPHTIDSIFWSTVCYLYLQQGALHSFILFTWFMFLKRRVKRFGGIVFLATRLTAQDKLWKEELFETILRNPPRAVEECTIEELEALVKAGEFLQEADEKRAKETKEKAKMDPINLLYKPGDRASMEKAVCAVIKAKLVPGMDEPLPPPGLRRGTMPAGLNQSTAARESTHEAFRWGDRWRDDDGDMSVLYNYNQVEENSPSFRSAIPALVGHQAFF